MCVPVHFSNLKNAEFNINALYTYTCIRKCEINLLHITLRVKCLKHYKNRLSFLKVRKCNLCAIFSYTPVVHLQKSVKKIHILLQLLKEHTEEMY